MCCQYFRASNSTSGGVEENEVSQTNILELNFDCCLELFDWLTLSDLRALRQTCTRLRKIVDYHIQSTYPKGFGKLLVYNDKKTLKDLRNFDSSFGQLYKSLRVKCYPNSGSHIKMFEAIRPILSSVQKVYSDHVNEHSNVDFLQLCTNLKFLEMVHPGDNKWLQYKLPTLEHVRLCTHSYNQLSELKTFFKLNPNIRQFTIGWNSWGTHWLKELNFHLDEFGIKYSGKIDELPEFCRLIHEMFERGLYKRLNFYFWNMAIGGSLKLLASLKGLEKLCLQENCFFNFVRTPMPQIKELYLSSSLNEVDSLDELVESFINIEKIKFGFVDFNCLVPFIRRSAKLKMVNIEVSAFQSDKTYCHERVINLPALNKERMKCAGASKVTIYVEEQFYVKTKEALMKTDFSLIKLKRATSIKWNEELQG